MPFSCVYARYRDKDKRSKVQAKQKFSKLKSYKLNFFFKFFLISQNITINNCGVAIGMSESQEVDFINIVKNNHVKLTVLN